MNVSKKNVFDFIEEDEPVQERNNKTKPETSKKKSKKPEETLKLLKKKPETLKKKPLKKKPETSIKKKPLKNSRTNFPETPTNKLLHESLERFLTGDINLWHKFRGRPSFIVPWIRYLFENANPKYVCIPEILPLDQKYMLHAVTLKKRDARFLVRPIKTKERQYYPELSALKKTTPTTTTRLKKIIQHSKDEEVVYISAIEAVNAGVFKNAGLLFKEIMKCEKMNGIIWSLYFVTIRFGESLAHANVLVFNHETKVLQRFEPHGVLEQPRMKLVDNKFELLVKRFQTEIPGISYQPMSNICISKGPQKLELESLVSKNSEFVFGIPVRLLPGGLCSVWSLLFMHFRLTYVELSNKDIVTRILGEPDILAVEIRRYSSAIVKFIESI
jgi:hypothetical protein